jgi:hypothetical protein
MNAAVSRLSDTIIEMPANKGALVVFETDPAHDGRFVGHDPRPVNMMVVFVMACMHSAVIYGGASRARVPALSRQAFN